MTTTRDERERQIAAELEALGEAPPSAEEFAAWTDDAHFVERLAEVAYGDPIAPLDELGARRTWSEVERRLVEDRPLAAATPSTPPGRRGGVIPLLVGVLALAAAVGLAFIVAPSGPRGEGASTVANDATHASDADPAVDLLAAQARAGLAALGVDEGSASKRARTMRSDFRRALGEPSPAGDVGGGAG